MANVLSQFVKWKISEGATDIFRDEIFCRAMGYLSQSPKLKRSRDRPIDDFLTVTEVERLNRYFKELLLDLEEWLSRNRFDEADRFPDEASASFERKVLLLVQQAIKDEISLTKHISRGDLFCPVFFEKLERELPCKFVLPDELDRVLADMGGPSANEESDREETRRFHENVLAGISILASDALTSGSTHSRPGTAGERAQEDEVISRYKSGRYGSLSAAVAAVLRDPSFVVTDGYPNTQPGRRKCYNRVYALLHPFRRRKSKPKAGKIRKRPT